jgi:hypothetical protein
MSGEEQLLARAERLADLDEHRYAVRELIDGMRQSGADHASVTRLLGAHSALDGGAVPYNPGTIKDRQAGGGYGSEGEFLEALHEATGQVHDRARDVTALTGRLTRAAGELGAELGDAQRELEAAHAMPVKDECDGCHGRRQTAINAAEIHIADVKRRIRIVQDALEILGELRPKLDQGGALLRQVPHDLGEVYELVYAFVAGGGKMPVHGRWLEGAGRLCAAR